MSTDPLYSLTAALSPAEKRYVGLFLTRQLADEKSNAAFLFETLCKIPEATDEICRKKVASRITARNFSAEKSGLYRSILLCMRIYHDQFSVDSNIRELLIEAEFLFQKRLYDASMERLGKARDLALQFERRTAMADILQLEADINYEKREKGFELFIETNHEAQLQNIRNLEKEARIKMHRERVFIGIRTRFYTNETDASETWQPKLPEPDELKNEGFNYRHSLYTASALQFSRDGKLEEAAATYDILLHMWETHPHRKINERMMYKKMLSNIINVNQLLHRNARAGELITLLQAVKSYSAEEEAEQFQVVQFARLMLYINSAQWDKTDLLIAEIEEGLQRYKTKINRARDFAFRCNIAVSYFIRQQWPAALRWFNSIIDAPKTEHRLDIQQMVRVMRLLCYYETGMHDLLEYELINTERYVRQRKTWTVFESQVIRAIKKLLDTDAAGKPEVFNRLYGQLKAIKMEDDKRYPPGYAEIMIWAEAGYSATPMDELFRREIEAG